MYTLSENQKNFVLQFQMYTLYIYMVYESFLTVYSHTKFLPPSRQIYMYVYISTSPAPWNTIVLSDNLVLVSLREAKSPATATAAVPCMSSLNVQ